MHNVTKRKLYIISIGNEEAGGALAPASLIYDEFFLAEIFQDVSYLKAGCSAFQCRFKQVFSPKL